MLATREAVEATGMFAEKYFIYFEDSDWCRRMVRAGYQLLALPGAGGIHDVSSSLGKCSPRFYYLRTRNRMWFFTAHSPCPPARTRRAILGHVLSHSFYPELRAGHLAAAAAIAAGFFAGLFVPRTVRLPG